jgi:UDP-N-acetylmuramate--alanine ligase
MLPLALYFHGRGAQVEGSDRALDQRRAEGLRQRLTGLGIRLHPQDGSGITGDEVLVTSSAVEATIPDVAAAVQKGSQRMIRAELLASIANGAAKSCGVAGTSGKSTTTAMIAHILAKTDRDPAVVNGAPMLNFRAEDAKPVAYRQGEGPFVCEVDESDGSIALYSPSVGVLLNVSEDHKPMAELMELFGGYAERAGKVVLGVASEPVRGIARKLEPSQTITVGRDVEADLMATSVAADSEGVRAHVHRAAGGDGELFLPLMGNFNVDNALAAIAASELFGVSLQESLAALATFKGTSRRLETIGTANGVTVIDDFAHNPEKIAGSLRALTDSAARVHLFYQPHGYGPMRANVNLYEETFRAGLRPQDYLFISEPAYFGGTVEKTDEARRITETLRKEGRSASFVTERSQFLEQLSAAKPGDLVVIMGARDDSLTIFARQALDELDHNS